MTKLTNFYFKPFHVFNRSLTTPDYQVFGNFKRSSVIDESVKAVGVDPRVLVRVTDLLEPGVLREPGVRLADKFLGEGL